MTVTLLRRQDVFWLIIILLWRRLVVVRRHATYRRIVIEYIFLHYKLLALRRVHSAGTRRKCWCNRDAIDNIFHCLWYCVRIGYFFLNVLHRDLVTSSCEIVLATARVVLLLWFNVNCVLICLVLVHLIWVRSSYMTNLKNFRWVFRNGNFILVKGLLVHILQLVLVIDNLCRFWCDIIRL